jgi:transposase InsO family protein
VSPARKREAVEHLQEKFDASQRRACEVVDQPRSTQRYAGRIKDDEPKLVQRMLELVRQRPRFGYRRIAALMRAEGWDVNVKRIYRLWRREGLKVPRKTRKRRGLGSSANACHVRRAESKDHVWTWDFVFDHTTSGTTLKWLSIVDEHTRECLALKVARSITSEDVIDTLAELFATRGVPRCVRSDNGPEFVALALRRWFEKTGVTTLYIEPGAPWENGFAESFHSRLRDELLGMHDFADLREARTLTAAWREDYNHCRPHSSLGYQTPASFAAAGGANSVRATPSLRRHPRQEQGKALPVT